MRALDRVLAVLETVAASDGGASISAVAARTGISLPTASRFMREMARAGLLTHTTRTFQLGPRLITLAQATNRKGSLIGLAVPYLEELRDISGETASLHVRAGDRRVCLAVVESTQEVRRVVEIGFTLPIVAGSTGQTFLAFMPAPERQAIIETVPAARRAALIRRVTEIRDAGYAAAEGTAVRGISGVTAPVSERGVCLAVVSVSGPSFRWTMEAIELFTPVLIRVAADLSGRLNGSSPTVPVAH